MATKEKPEINEEIMNDPLTVVAAEKKESYTGPTVRIFLPKLEEEGNGVRVDQYEHVTIANEHEYREWKVKRGEYVDVPVPVFVALKESGRYPNI